jgi:hypothetical protein
VNAPTVKVVRYRSVFGTLGEKELEIRGDFVSPGSALDQRLVVVDHQLFLCKYVSRAAGERDPRLYALLDNEIRAGARIGQVYGGHHPPELSSAVAYNLDDEEPFVLLRAYSGEPAASQVQQFDDATRRQFQIGLLRAVQLTAAAGVVHGAVSLDTVRWDGRQLQLVDFESAERVGDRRRGGSSPARSPEQAAASGEVDARDDLWAAGLLIRQLYVGGLTNGSRPDRGRDPELLRTLLDPVFDNPIEHRPQPADLLRLLRVESTLPQLADPEGGLHAGRAEFEKISTRKRGSAEPEPEPQPDMPAPTGRFRLSIPFLTTMIVVAAAIIVLAVWI